ncbi:unnamed protein product [Rotaria magnacalcarata]|uniref:Uncharacterized protein n=1 Tax=Rotaria magnacalcarata TaxID=392030 RepID=A0A815SNB0_9BILA|nr:unnamed protein product [Rotaria magnacalcarata]CAF1492060.1 unnamed protein product [Rotaria magnacalcarata]CAF1938833.1 unnamed protein product [Rotaria magnacalcarata]CAF4095165.1 unnamed protein product [Rotaria magnacalcarata]CAF4464187.1 unnamed protein product [Rotaria magnacalcarata]
MYNNLRAAEYERRHFDQALVHFEKALEIHMKCLLPVHPQTVVLYNSMGHAYSGHPEISQAYCNIGGASRSLKDYARAVSNCEKALIIARNCLPSTHLDLAEVYSGTNESSMVLTYFLKALDIYTKNPLINSFTLGVLYEKIGIEYSTVEKYEEALKYFQMTLDIFQSFHEVESSLKTLFFNLGRVYHHNNDYDNALIYTEKYIQFELMSILNINYQELSQAYDTLGDIHCQRKNYSVALQNYENALESVEKVDSISSTEEDRSTLIQQYQK